MLLAVVVGLTLLVGGVLPARSKSVATDIEGSDEAEKWLPAAASASCLYNLFGHGAVFKIPNKCRSGYARHSNGRCYRVVDELPQDGTVPANPYQVTHEKICDVEVTYDGYDQEMESQGRLDVCDEDGGCDHYVGFGEGFSGQPVCRKGYELDNHDRCQKKQAKQPNPTRRPQQQSRHRRKVYRNRNRESDAR